MKQKLTLSDFANLLSQREGVSKRDAEIFVRAFFDLIENGLEQDKLVKIKGLGTFKLVSVSERESVNIATGERFQINGHTKVTFTPDNSMKELVNRPFAHFEAIELNEETSTSEFDEIDEEMREAEEEEEQPEAEDSTDEEEIPSTEEETPASEEESPADEETAIPTLGENEEEPEETAEPQVTAPEPLHISEPSKEEPQPKPLAATTVPEQSKTAADEDIVVTSPTPISAQAQTAPEPEPLAEAEASEPRTSSAGHTSNTGGGYVYEPVPLPKKRNVWKTVALALAMFILMAVSYFAGYYRVLCPTCHEEEFVMDTIASQPEPVSAPDTVAVPVKEEKPDTVKPAPAEKADTAAKPAAPKPAPQPKTEEKKAEPAKRPTTHTVKTGDNVYRIARKYYGSDSYAERIIKANNLKNANTITVGMTLTLP